MMQYKHEVLEKQTKWDQVPHDQLNLRWRNVLFSKNVWNKDNRIPDMRYKSIKERETEENIYGERQKTE